MANTGKFIFSLFIFLFSITSFADTKLIEFSDTDGVIKVNFSPLLSEHDKKNLKHLKKTLKSVYITHSDVFLSFLTDFKGRESKHDELVLRYEGVSTLLRCKKDNQGKELIKLHEQNPQVFDFVKAGFGGITLSKEKAKENLVFQKKRAKWLKRKSTPPSLSYCKVPTVLL
jgi:hypothetical protein